MHGWAGTVGAGTRAGQNVTLRNTESIIAAAPSRLCQTVYELHRMPREAVAGQKRTNSRMPAAAEPWHGLPGQPTQPNMRAPDSRRLVM